jgi:hypothetical protein
VNIFLLRCLSFAPSLTSWNRCLQECLAVLKHFKLRNSVVLFPVLAFCFLAFFQQIIISKMRITLVVTCVYAGVALSAPVQQVGQAIEAQNQWPSYLGGGGSYEGSGGYDGGDSEDADPDDAEPSWSSPAWAKPKDSPRLPSYYASSQTEQRPGLFSFLGMGSQGWGSQGRSGTAYPSPLSPKSQSCETSASSSYLGNMFRGFFSGGNKDCGASTRPAAPFAASAPKSPYVPYAPYAPYAPYGAYGPAPIPRPHSQAMSAIPSPAVPKPSSSLVPSPKSVERPSPLVVASPIAPKPTPATAVKPSPSSSAAARVPTIGLGSHSASPEDEDVPMLPSSKAIPSPVTSAEKKLPTTSATPLSSSAAVPLLLPLPSPAAPRSSSATVSLPSPSPASPAVDPVSPIAQLQRTSLWQPQVAEPFQIILSGHPDINAKLTPEHVNIFDIDLFNTPVAVIESLRSQGKKVICYFSAGSAEEWRPDYNQFDKQDLGDKVSKDDQGSSFWEGEKWVNIKNPNPSSSKLPTVWKIMRDRIKMAAEKGCNAIDPDNVGKFIWYIPLKSPSNNCRWLWKQKWPRFD